jgi:hypothetical protein
MSASEKAGVSTQLELVLKDSKGKIKEIRKYEGDKLILSKLTKKDSESKDLIVNAGKAAVAGLINGVVTTPFTYIAIGTGTNAPSPSDTSLQSETHRQSATCSREQTNVPNDTAVLVTTFTFSSSYSITESGCFDASSGGNMLCRQTFSAINVGAGDSLQVTWKIVVSTA